jgi:hypothetical protein
LVIEAAEKKDRQPAVAKVEAERLFDFQVRNGFKQIALQGRLPCGKSLSEPGFCSEVEYH